MPIVEARFLDTPFADRAGAVDDVIDPAVPLQRVGDCATGIVFLGEIRLEGEDVIIAAEDVFDVLLIATGRDYGRAGFAKQLDGGAADAAGRAGDQRDLSFSVVPAQRYSAACWRAPTVAS